MKLFRTAAVLFAATLLSTGCNRPSGPPDDTTKTPPSSPGKPSPAREPVTMASTFEPATAVDPQAAVRTRCALDTINGQQARGQAVTVVTGGEARFRGWVADPKRRVPDAFTIILAGETSYGAAAKAGNPRKDVARATRIKSLANSGFDVTAQLAQVAPGEYTVGLLQANGGQTAYCATMARLVVTSAGG